MPAYSCYHSPAFFLLVCLPLLIVAETLWQDVPCSCVFHKQYLFVSITKMIRNSKHFRVDEQRSLAISLRSHYHLFQCDISIGYIYNLSMTLPVSLLFERMMNDIGLFLLCLLSCPASFSWFLNNHMLFFPKGTVYPS